MEQLKHECGVAVIRLLKPLEYYQKKYGTWLFGLNKLYLMMEKQHNRGQDAAGIACVKQAAQPGEEFIFRDRALGSNAIQEIFSNVHHSLNKYDLSIPNIAAYAERYLPFAGSVYLGHLRYSTTGKSGMPYVHPFLRRNNWRAKSLCICANFNMTNVDDIFDSITKSGQHPRMISDTHLLLEQLGHRLDSESERLFKIAEEKKLEGKDITYFIEDNIDIVNVLKTASPCWDGGYVLSGATGSGEVFTMRDPWGIRPAFWFKNDEFFALASERPVLQTTFELETDQINELKPGEAVMVNKKGKFRLEQILAPKKYAACSFERIYFSRGSDEDIYRERKCLGGQLLDPILKSIAGDLCHTVFSYIPNTAESAFYGMVNAFNDYLNDYKTKKIEALGDVHDPKKIKSILSQRVRSEKIAWKDIKMRTFIAEGNSRNDLAAHVYDITYGGINPYVDNLVVIDDSIVRGTTLRESIIGILDRLHPKKLVIVSSSPQIKYPDYYGIDMARLDEFIAFRTAISLLQGKGMWHVIEETYRNCVNELKKPVEEMKNCVKAIYAPFTDEDISKEMVILLKSSKVKTEVEIVYQTIEGLHKACPNNPGDWYFTGNYPTPGGMKNVNKAFISYYEEVYNK